MVLAKRERLRSPLPYYGGKGNMVSKLLKLVPPGGRPYCEPYCGGASLFFAREPAPVEVLNDLDGEIVNVFRVLQDRANFEELRHRLMYTPYARSEFIRALAVDENASPLERAWATLVKHNFAISAIAETPGNWARAFKTSGGMADKTNKWLMRLAMLDAWHWRLMRVQIDSRDAIEVIRYWDNPDAVFYLDPPYHCAVVSSHTVRRAYKRTTGDEHYRELAETILQCQGAVVLSGYACDALKPLEEHGWERIDFRTACHALAKTRQLGNIGKGSSSKLAPRVESVWRNRRAIELCGSPKAKDR